MLVPLCGKSLDLFWLAHRGHRPIGVEMIERAVDELFADAGLSAAARGDRRSGGGVTVRVSDIFEVSDLGPIDAVWDRAALIALPPERRAAYRDKIRELAPGAPILLSAVDYDRSVMSGPPWAITPDEVAALYPSAERIASDDIVDSSPRWREVGHAWFCSDVYFL